MSSILTVGNRKMQKTNAMRILDKLSIEYDTATYEYDESNLDAKHAAESLGVPEERVFKTIVMKSSDNRIFVFCLPSLFEVSLKKARSITGSNSIEPLKSADLRKYTGYIRGGCSPLGMVKKYPTYISELAMLEDKIYVSAGERGIQLILKPDDLVKAAEAIYSDFV